MYEKELNEILKRFKDLKLGEHIVLEVEEEVYPEVIRDIKNVLYLLRDPTETAFRSHYNLSHAEVTAITLSKRKGNDGVVEIIFRRGPDIPNIHR